MPRCTKDATCGTLNLGTPGRERASERRRRARQLALGGGEREGLGTEDSCRRRGEGTYLRTGVLRRCSLLHVDRALRLVWRGLQGLVLRRGAGEGEGQEEGGGQQVGFSGRHGEACAREQRTGGSERRAW